MFTTCLPWRSWDDRWVGARVAGARALQQGRAQAVQLADRSVVEGGRGRDGDGQVQAKAPGHHEVSPFTFFMFF